MKFLWVSVFPLLVAGVFAGGYTPPGAVPGAGTPGGSGGTPGGGGAPPNIPGPPTKPAAIKLLVDNMNYLRTTHGAGPLAADATLNAKALACANKVRAKNPTADSVDNGDPTNINWICDPTSENMQYFCLSEADVVDEAEVVNGCFQRWSADERAGYIFDELRTYVEASRHFTQMIWKKTTRVGVGISALATTTDKKKVLVVLFSPAGNTVNGQSNREFLANIGFAQSFKGNNNKQELPSEE